MADDFREFRTWQIDTETRLGSLEQALGDLRKETRQLGKLFRGNGERGFVALIQVQDARLGMLERQWRWIAGAIITLLATLVSSLACGLVGGA